MDIGDWLLQKSVFFILNDFTEKFSPLKIFKFGEYELVTKLNFKSKTVTIIGENTPARLEYLTKFNSYNEIKNVCTDTELLSDINKYFLMLKLSREFNGIIPVYLNIKKFVLVYPCE